MRPSVEGVTGGEIPTAPGGGYAWYVCLVLLLAYVFSFLDRSIIGLLVVPMEHDLAVGDTEISLLNGFSFAIFYGLLGLPIARRLDGHARRGVIIAGILTWSLATAACGLVDGFWAIFVCRILVGAGEAALVPGAASLIADYFPVGRRGRPMGVFAMGIFLGAGGALIAGGSIVEALGDTVRVLPLLGHVKPWQLVFLIVGLPGLAIALLVSTIREPQRNGAIAGGLPLRIVANYLSVNRRALGCHLAGLTVLSMATYAANSWLPTVMIRDHGWSAGETGRRLGLLAIGLGPFGSLTGGWLADRMRRAGHTDAVMRVGLFACLAALPFALGYPLVANAWVAIGLLVPFFFFSSFFWSIGPVGLQELVPSQMRAQATALYTGATSLIGLGCGPTLVALIAGRASAGGHGIAIGLAVVGGCAGTIAAFLFALGRAPYRQSIAKLAFWNGA